jgi:hypothetical protein
MSEFSLPTPREAGYYNDHRVDDALLLIQKMIAGRSWALRPKPNWNSVEMFPKIDEEIAREWTGLPEEGCEIWKVVPI